LYIEDLALVRRAFNFSFIGVGCAIFHIASLSVLVALLGAHDASAQLYINVMAFFPSGAANFILNDRWTFERKRLSGTWVRFGKFSVIVVIQGVVVFWVSNGILRYIGVASAHIYAALVLTVCSFIIKFVVMDTWIYGEDKTTQGHVGTTHLKGDDPMHPAIVLPAYNEEANIVSVVDDVYRHMQTLKLQDVISGFTVIVVDDGSRDNTYSECYTLRADFSELTLVQHEVNCGYGAAVRTGIETALSCSEVTGVFMMDADGQFEISAINRFLDITREKPQAFVAGYREKRADGMVRKINGFGWTLVNSILIRHIIRDVDCASKWMPRDLLEGAILQGEAATVNFELFMYAKMRGYEIIQIPVPHLPRIAGHQTGAKLSVILTSFSSLFRRWREIRSLPSTV